MTASSAKTAADDALAAVKQTRALVFGAFQTGDVDSIIQCFHPDVIQIPAFNKVLIGREAVKANYAATFGHYTMAFEDTLEDMTATGGLVMTHGTYTVSLTPKSGGDTVSRSGRYMVIMHPWHESPTGWATYRELAQAAL